jgi:hypothetical protein
MSEDLFQFWSRCPGSEHVHPDDKNVLDRTAHGFDLRCLPSPFTGPLRHAPAVLLFIAPGFDPFDLDHAEMSEAQAWYGAQRTGNQPLSNKKQHRTHYRWWTKIIRQFGVAEGAARDKIAIFDIAPYHSKTFGDGPLLSALPSARKAIDWAQTTLFPAALNGDRSVICLRGASYWGLSSGPDGRVFGEALYCPVFTRGGFMLRGEMRESVRAAVQARLQH